MNVSSFKAYDIRGRVPDELNADMAYRIGRAYAGHLSPRSVVVGRDVRLSSPELAEALSDGLMAAGADVYDIGVCGTEEVYYATFARHMDGGIMVTASHNPMDYNGMKLVRGEARPISGDTGLFEIKRLVLANGTPEGLPIRGRRQALDVTRDYIEHLLGYVRPDRLRPLTIVANSGNGSAGRIVDALAPHLPVRFVRIQHEPDGTFPNGVPNPLLPENRAVTSEAVRSHGADLGIAWDGDFDRCFLFDETGEFVEGYYMVGMLAAAFLERESGAKIVHDPRLVWNTIELVRAAGGVPVESKTGHAFIKERMRQEDAVYGGEMSAHHYFRDFAYCDSGMIPWLLVTELMSETGKPLSALVGERKKAYPVSGEINRRLEDPAGTLKEVEERYRAEALAIRHTDGLSMEFPEWRFNLRSSNTEPVARLNVETRGNEALMREKTRELLGELGEGSDAIEVRNH